MGSNYNRWSCLFVMDAIGRDFIEGIYKKCFEIIFGAYECFILNKTGNNNSPQSFEISRIDMKSKIAADILVASGLVKMFSSTTSFVITEKGIKAIEVFNDWKTVVGL